MAVQGVAGTSSKSFQEIREKFEALGANEQAACLRGLKEADPATAERLVSETGYIGVGTQTKQGIVLPSAKTGPATAPPRGKKLSPEAQRAYHQLQADAEVSCEVGGKKKTLTGVKLAKVLNDMPQQEREAFLKKNDMVLEDGVYRVKGAHIQAIEDKSAGGTLSTASGMTHVSPWLAAGVGVATGGVVGGVVGYQTAKTYNGLSSGANGVLSTASAAASALGLATDGIQFRLKAQMASVAREGQHTSMIGMINSGMPIEDLIFMFIIHMGETYDKKLREKMEEALIAEKLQERQQRRLDAANHQAGLVEAAGAAASSIPIVGGFINAGAQVGAKAVREVASSMNQLEGGLNGGMKSSTQLSNEVQMLMQKWKAMTELASNLLKMLHDMQMTPIRNLR